MAPKTTDARFARLQTDPRFRRPNKKTTTVEIDERFKDVLESEEFGGKGKGKGKAKASEGGKLSVSLRRKSDELIISPSRQARKTNHCVPPS